MRNGIRKHRFGALLAASLSLALLPAAGSAQQPVDSRWLPWLGCWQISGEPGGAPANLLVCVRPGPAANAVEVTTLSEGEIASTRTLMADGQPHAVQDEACSGSQFAQFSGDARRVYLWSTLTCAGGIKRTASAIMALASRTEWLDAQALGVNGKRMPRAVRYRLAPAPIWPAGFALTAQRAEAAADARLVASGRLSLADVQEAFSSVDPEALVAFVLEWNQPFDLDAAKLASLADVGVPGDVIDAVVAVSYPTRFIIDRGAGSLALAPSPQREPRTAGGTVYGDPFGWGGWGYGRCYGGLAYWSSYCGPSVYWASSFGFGGYPYWFDPYWYGNWGQPIIVVTGSNGGSGVRHGTVLRGGYTRGGEPASSGGGRYAHPRGTPAQDRSGPSYAPPAPSGASRSSGGSVSPGGYSRTGGSPSSGSSPGSAKPKCCS